MENVDKYCIQFYTHPFANPSGLVDVMVETDTLTIPRSQGDPEVAVLLKCSSFRYQVLGTEQQHIVTVQTVVESGDREQSEGHVVILQLFDPGYLGA